MHRSLAVAALALTLTACSAGDAATRSAEPADPSVPSTASPNPETSSPETSSPEKSSPETSSPEKSSPETSAPEPSAAPDAEESSAPDPETFTATTSRITPALEARMRWSHRAGCPVGLGDLRHLRLSYVDLGGVSRTGELVVHEDVAREVVEVFRRLHAARWPVARMRLVDAYRGDDDRSMAANNTSAYNCRSVGGSTSWSEHAYGTAIDVNPVQNPYVQTGSVAPPAGRRYADLDRSPGSEIPPGVIRSGDVVVRAFAVAGWEWGGDWSSAKDYQHFSLSGR